MSNAPLHVEERVKVLHRRVAPLRGTTQLGCKVGINQRALPCGAQPLDDRFVVLRPSAKSAEDGDLPPLALSFGEWLEGGGYLGARVEVRHVILRATGAGKITRSLNGWDTWSETRDRET